MDLLTELKLGESAYRFLKLCGRSQQRRGLLYSAHGEWRMIPFFSLSIIRGSPISHPRGRMDLLAEFSKRSTRKQQRMS
ncbi:hypothetical protein QN277_011290 [Acacia crassicarpa]|uniref:Uncharacterized protein n=1 Tax=Acacia crassicarpa TaxID=499986 RepID=A0AAE1MY89_9FABA|nr:hypothetical protein QN277_011290 [Acacia crassicarpa]